ncbi:MAG: YciI family protein [Candidatus Acidiferrum sp.]
MGKAHFFVELIPPRPTFPMDITPEEKLLMQEHARYTHEGFASGKILIYGPVMALGGAFGIAVFEAQNEAEARQFVENDPTVRAGLNTFDVSPMRVAEARGFGPVEKE